MCELEQIRMALAQASAELGNPISSQDAPASLEHAIQLLSDVSCVSREQAEELRTQADEVGRMLARAGAVLAAWKEHLGVPIDTYGPTVASTPKRFLANG